MFAEFMKQGWGLRSKEDVYVSSLFFKVPQFEVVQYLLFAMI